MFAAGINSNAAFERASNAHGRSDRELQFSRTRLGSGMRINTARDDVGGLSISEGMRAEIDGLTEGTRNTEKSIDLLRTAAGAMGEISSILIRMSELATQVSTDALNDKSREAVHSEFNQLKDYIDRVAKQASYNDQNLLSGFGNDVNDVTSTAIDALADNGIRRVKLSSVEGGTYTSPTSPLTIVSPLAMAPRRRPSSSVRSWTVIMSQKARHLIRGDRSRARRPARG